MAISVPRYTNVRELPGAPNQMPSVRQTAAPSADQLGGNARVPTNYIGKGLASAAQDFTDVGLRMQDREDSDLILRAEISRDNELRERQADWQSRKGVNAWNLTKEVSDWWDKDSAKHAEGLNERQRAVFEQRSAARRAGSLDTISRYEVAQRIESQAESQQAAINNQINRAVDNFGNKPERELARVEVGKLVNMQAKLLGWDPERVQFEMTKTVSNYHARVIEAMAATDAKGAKAYLDERRHEIDAGTLGKIDTALKATTELEDAQETADKLERDGATEQDGLAYIRENFSGTAEKTATAEWASRMASAERARERAQRDVRDKAWDVFAEGGGIAAIRNAGLWADLDGKDREAFITRQMQAAEQQASRADRAENRAFREEQRRLNDPEAKRTRELKAYMVNDRLMNLLANDPQAYAQANLMRETDLPVDAIGKHRELQRKILNGEAIDLELKVVNNEVGAAVKSLDIKDTKKRAEASALFRKEYEEEIAAHREQNQNKSPSKAERQKIADGLLQRGYTEGWFGSRNETRRFQAGDDKFISLTPAKPEAATGANSVPSVSPKPSTQAERNQLPKPLTQAEFRALPSGTKFIDPKTGRTSTKP